MAVLRDGVLLGARATSDTHPHASGLFTDLQSLLDELSLSLGMFDLFAVAAGPGSFTGLRIGLTAAKAWAEAFSRPVVAVSSLEAIACQALELSDLSAGTPVVAVQDARRGQIFGRVYDYTGNATNPLEPIGEEVLLPAPDFLSLIAGQMSARTPVFASPAVEPIRSALEISAFANARFERVSPVLAPFIGQIGCARALQGQVIDALQLDANYVRRADAEEKWQDAKSKEPLRGQQPPKQEMQAKGKESSPA